MATLEKEIQHLRDTDHSFVTNGDIVTLLTKTGHVDYYDTLFDEYREVLLFRMVHTYILSDMYLYIYTFVVQKKCV